MVSHLDSPLCSAVNIHSSFFCLGAFLNHIPPSAPHTHGRTLNVFLVEHATISDPVFESHLLPGAETTPISLSLETRVLWPGQMPSHPIYGLRLLSSFDGGTSVLSISRSVWSLTRDVVFHHFLGTAAIASRDSGPTCWSFIILMALSSKIYCAGSFPLSGMGPTTTSHSGAKNTTSHKFAHSMASLVPPTQNPGSRIWYE